MTSTVSKRLFTRSRNELTSDEEVMKVIRNKSIEEYNVSIANTIRLQLDDWRKKLQNFEIRRENLEKGIDDESQLEQLIPREVDDLHHRLSGWLLEIEANLLTFESNEKRKEKLKLQELDDRKAQEVLEWQEKLRQEELDRQEKQRQEDRADRKEREANELKVKLEEISVKKMEIEKLGSNSTSISNMSNGSAKLSHLPKIELVKFSGDIEEYQGFLDNFKSLVHSRSDLEDNTKFHYLKGQLYGEASSLIEGIRVTNENYKLALDILNNEYGSPDLFNNKLFHDIKRSEARSNRVEDVHELFRTLEIKLKMLDNQGINLNDILLSSVLFAKLPYEIQQKMLEEKHGEGKITTKDIREKMSAILKMNRLYKSINPDMEGPSVSTPKVPRQINTTPNSFPTRRFTTEALYSRTFNRTNTNVGQYNNESNRPRQQNITCAYCSGPHYPDQCNQYATISQRKDRLGQGCYICLKPSHYAKECTYEAACYYCNKRGVHHRSLCDRQFGPKPNSNNLNRSGNNAQAHMAELNEMTPSSSSGVDVLSALSQVRNSAIFMQTVSLRVYSKKLNKVLTIRALFDSASSHSFVTKNLYEQLNLEERERGELNIFTFGAKSPNKLKVVESDVTVIDLNNRKHILDVIVVPNIVGSRNVKNYDKNFLFNLNKQYKLSDQYLLEDEMKDIDLLIGINYYSKFMSTVRVNVEENLFLWDTSFGYVLSGTKSFPSRSETQDNTVLFVDVNFELDSSDNIAMFWDLQTLGIKDKYDVSNDDLALQSFDSTVKYEFKRYSVTFPWKNTDRDIQSNYGLALGQLKSIIRRHENDGILDVCYQTFEEQLEKGVLERVPDIEPAGPVHYLPYHAVVRDTSQTTKIRFVMNASARQNKTKPSLNDLLYRGPVLLGNLGSLLMRFRLNQFAIIADIEKAFLNISLQESERDFTRILWLKDHRKPVEKNNIMILRHQRLPFGIKSSPFILARVIDTHLSKYEGKFMEKLRSDIYVDNVVTGVDSEDEIQEFIERSRSIFNEASLNLREWATNRPNEYYNTLPGDVINPEENQNVLGLNWNVRTDELNLKFQFFYNNEKICRRLLLSVYASFFDILGLWSPITVSLKLLIQKTWTLKLGWEDEISHEDQDEFFKILKCMNSVSKISIPRHVNVYPYKNIKYELHGFSDATKDSYACCVYLRSISESDGIKVDVLFAKSRIAPVKKPSLPRLELLGALIAFRAIKYVIESLHLEISETFLWIDNQCVLHWLTGNKILPIFINNRVKEIKSAKFPMSFLYVPSSLNPADIGCRGSLNLGTCVLWWKGPAFLSQVQWPQFQEEDEKEEIGVEEGNNVDDELSTVAMTLSHTNKQDEIRKPVPINEEKYTSFNKLVNITSYIFKFINTKCKKVPSSGYITGEEYQYAMTEWLKYHQQNYFKSTIELLQRDSRDLLAIQLGLVLNKENLLVCKGRFREMKLCGREYFPILLPRKGHITSIIIHDVHRQCFHAGVNQTLCSLRLNYWIPQGRSTVRSVLKDCVHCKKYKHGSYKSPEFSFLPSYRVNQAIAFTYTAVDYFGPMSIKNDKHVASVWGLIFTCLTTRAVHLELVDSEATTDLILAFRRFIARRGKCKFLLTDNASQFKLLGEVLNAIYRSNQFNDYLNKEKIVHKYTHPLSPWEGGVYERLISIIKQSLRKTIANLLLTKTQLHTVIVEIESVMNSRPLGYVTEADFMITPRHFLELKGDMLGEDEYYDPIKGKTITFRNMVQLWKKGTSYLDKFWHHWSHMYLTSLRERKQVMFQQGKTTSLEPREGEIVLIKEDKLNRSNWPYGRIIKLHRSPDNNIRTVTLRTRNNTEIVRHVSLLYPLEY